MLETIRYATISNIYVKDLIFYDAEKEPELKSLCLGYGISYLPHKNRKECYKLKNGSFYLTPLSEDLICQPYDRIFDKKTLLKFEKGSHDEVMFVVDEGVIKGVVHIVDYNTDFINFEFYKLTFQFEKMLRKLLIQKGESNESILNWMQGKSLKNKHWSRRYHECVPIDKEKAFEQELKRKECNPFQTFYLNDLLFFVASRKYVSLEFRQNLEAIKGIRNWVSHSKDLTQKRESETHPVYKIDGLKEFVKNANIFFKCFEELEFKIQKEDSTIRFDRL